MSKLSDSTRIEEARQRLLALHVMQDNFTSAPLRLAAWGSTLTIPPGTAEDTIRARALSVINARIAAIETALAAIDVDPAT